MTDAAMTRARRSGAALVAFVAVQVTYLIVQMVWMSPPNFSFGHLGALRTFVGENAVTLRDHTLIALAAFIFLFLPGTIGLRRHLQRTTPEGSLLPDLVGAGLLLVAASVFIGSVSYAVLAVPGDPLSDSVLSASMMDNNYSIFVVGSFAVALFVGATALALMRSHAPRWLSWWGLATAIASVVGTLWIVSARLDGPLYGLSLAARASFLAWVAATGVWLLRHHRATAQRDGAMAAG